METTATAKTSHLKPTMIWFMLGKIVATPGALDLLERTSNDPIGFLIRHQQGDWGSVPPEDAEENLSSIENGCRILSSYFLNATERLWIITEADRSSTTLLLPEEY